MQTRHRRGSRTALDKYLPNPRRSNYTRECHSHRSVPRPVPIYGAWTAKCRPLAVNATQTPSPLPAREISDVDPRPARPDRARLISAEPKRAETPVSGDVGDVRRVEEALPGRLGMVNGGWKRGLPPACL